MPRSAIRGLRQRLYTAYCIALFMSLGALILLGSAYSCPSLRARRQVAGAFSRGSSARGRYSARGSTGSSACRAHPASWSPIMPATSTASSPSRLCRRILPSSSRRRWCACRSRASCCGGWARHSSSASTGTRAPPTRAASGGWRPAASPWCSFRKALSTRPRQIGKFLGGAFATAERSQMHDRRGRDPRHPGGAAAGGA